MTDEYTRPRRQDYPSTFNVLHGPSLRLSIVVLLAVTVVVRQLSNQFQLLRVSASDYFVVALIGCALGVAFAVRRAPLDSDAGPGLEPPTASGTFVRAFLGLAIGTILGGAVLKVVNGALDQGPARDIVAVITSRHCTSTAFHSFILKSASDVPVTADSIELDVGRCGDEQAGDTVFLLVKPGFFNRPWIRSYRIETAQDRIKHLLERRGAVLRD